MKLAIDERRASMSVREFSEFLIGPTAAGPGYSGRWRAEQGNRWHREMQRQTEAVHDSVYFETTISGACFSEEWTIELQGRIDQIICDGDTRRLREIKTVTMELPVEPSELERKYPSYFNQLATYLHLSKMQPESATTDVIGELVFVSVTDGITQTVRLEFDQQEVFTRQMRRVIDFLNTRRAARRRLSNLSFKSPFTEARPGQEFIGEALAQSAGKSEIILFEAPTGFGKTGTILEFAFKQMRDGAFTRTLYLTGKSTGQLPVINQMGDMFENEGGAFYYQMRNRAEHAIRSPLHTCETGPGCRDGIEDRWRHSGFSPIALFESGTASLETVRATGRDTGLCPYEISKSLLPFADVWVGDYNYVFCPGSNSLFTVQPGFDPATTLLVIDEAHNLPSRVAGNFSHAYSTRDTDSVLTALKFAGAPPALVLGFERLHTFLSEIDRTDFLATTLEYELEEIIASLAEHLGNARIDLSQFASEVFDKLWNILEIKAFLAHPTGDFANRGAFEKLLWCPRKQKLNFTCLDASSEISAAIAPFGLTVLMSATLSPISFFTRSCGFDRRDCDHLEADTPWRNRAFDLVVDTRVDTSYRTREKHYRTTADTIAVFNHPIDRPLVVYFPSYRYAEMVSEYVKLEHPHLYALVQPRGLDLEDYERFIEGGLRNADAIFLVLGSSFSEGIDSLGGRVKRALIVGPALPEVNAVQRALMEERAHLAREEAFRQVYQIPAMIKINQALGRLVRAPGQNVAVILHCQRFGQPTYRTLLAPEYRDFKVVPDRVALQRWVSSLG